MNRLRLSLLLLSLSLALPSAQAAPTKQQLTRTPAPVASFGAIALDGWLYMIGGNTGGTHQHNKEVLSRGFYRLNLADRNSWESLPGGVGLQSVSLVTDGRSIIRVGGLAIHNKAGQKEDMRSTDEVMRFNPHTRRWSPLPKLPGRRSSHDAFVLNNKVYVFGGWNLQGDEFDWYNKGLVLDLQNLKAGWQTIKQPFHRRALAVTAANGKIYVLGGMTRSSKVSQRVDIYNPQTKTWSRGPELPGPGFGAAAAPYGSGIVATDWKGHLYRLSRDDKAWSLISRLAFPRFFHRLVQVGRYEVAAIAGASFTGKLRNIEWLAPRKATPMLTFELPFPGHTRQAQGALLHRGTLMLVGGNRSSRSHRFEPKHFSTDAYAVDIARLRIRPMASLPTPRQSFKTWLHKKGRNTTPYFLGGFGNTGDGPRSQSELLRYDSRSKKWLKDAAQLPKPLTQAAIVEIKERLYVLGGLDYDERRKESFQHSQAVYSWAPGEPAFRKESWQLPGPRRAFEVALVGHKLYLIGGMKENFQLVKTIDVLDLKTKTWSQAKTPALTRISPEVVVLGGRIFVAGGSSKAPGKKSFGPNPSIESYDPATNQWSTLVKKQPLGRGTRLFALPHRLLLVSNQSPKGTLRFAIVDPGQPQRPTSRPSKATKAKAHKGKALY